MATKIQFRRDTEANWTSVNPILSEGELGLDLTNTKIKIGDGATSWTSLPYAVEDGVSVTDISRTSGDGSAGSTDTYTITYSDSSTSTFDVYNGADGTGTVNTLADLGITATSTELNKLDGFTGSYLDLNYAKDLKATGVTATEFDYLDGVTSNIQTQLNNKQATLVSASNIKTVNGASILGSGDLEVGGGGVGEYILTDTLAISNDNSVFPNATTADYCVGIGSNIFSSGSSAGSYNVLLGYGVGNSSSDFGGFNVAIGYMTAKNNTGNNNVFIGDSSGEFSTLGTSNIGIGTDSISGDSVNLNTASDNIGIGRITGNNITTGRRNVFLGSSSGDDVSTGSNNTLIGYLAGYSLTTGSNNTCLGSFSNVSSSSISDEFTLGNSSVTSLRCQVTTITSLSDARDKENIEDLDAGLDFINSLRPVRFDWNMRDGGKVGENDIGFIAQELQQAQKDTNTTVPHLVYESNPDKLEAGYGMLIAPLVQAVKELSAKVDAQQEELKKLKGL